MNSNKSISQHTAQKRLINNFSSIQFSFPENVPIFQEASHSNYPQYVNSIHNIQYILIDHYYHNSDSNGLYLNMNNPSTDF